MKINWNEFARYCQDGQDVHAKFEDLCRQLFEREFLSSNVIHKHLHANPNNPGIEAEPILDERTNKRIGFQAKYFSAAANYSDIKDSAEKTVENYRGDIDKVYLYCNKPLTRDSFRETEEILKNADIELELITDAAILDLVRAKYDYLGKLYFGNHTISHQWFCERAEDMFELLGDRFNREFNVETEYSLELSLFVHDQEAVEYINNKKADLLQSIEKLPYVVEDEQYLECLKDVTNQLQDVCCQNLETAFEWKNTVTAEVSDYLREYERKLTAYKEERNRLIEIACDTEKDKVSRGKAWQKCDEIDGRIHRCTELTDLWKIIELDKKEQQLIRGHILMIKGDTGIGKTQLLAHKTNMLLQDGRDVLLLVAGTYLNEDPIKKQIVENLELDFSFDDLLDILEAIGEREHTIIPIFIDALNEIRDFDLWNIALPGIIKAVKKRSMIRMVLTYRTEAESALLTESVMNMQQDGTVLTINDEGFAKNQMQAVKAFMNAEGILFTPAEYLGYEMTNPLFLTLYCKTYNGEKASLPELYERLLQCANRGIFKSLGNSLKNSGYRRSDDLVSPLVVQIAKKMLDNGAHSIAKDELNGLCFWRDYGLAPEMIIRQLREEHILLRGKYGKHKNQKYYSFAYDQMYDYYAAKAIVENHEDKEELKNYLAHSVLQIVDGKPKNLINVDLFVHACALYAEKFREEAIGVIDRMTDDGARKEVFSRYIRSFQWRAPRYICTDKLKNLLSKYPYGMNDLWDMLFGNSIKIEHPLNADFLHEVLSSYELNQRDYLWTMYINSLRYDESNRVVQLIELYEQGEQMALQDEKQVELLLTLFAWVLTSSNRWLRDYTSKAMVEILKEHFNLCQVLLEKFKTVNDPYVIQRLYGIVFGAYCKQERKEYEEERTLAEFVYEVIFNQTAVYPDILLRDYARLIIERFLYENSEYSGKIDKKKITPPYESEPIPDIDDQHYLEGKYAWGTLSMIYSMRFDIGMGMYGDFGRYIFQSALRSFNVDHYKIFNYAIYYILHTLGYKEEYFGTYDISHRSIDRSPNLKTERIGKKYQWISMYNILARVSDHCNMLDRWNYPPKSDVRYEGAWDPNVRDFDPTLNQAFVKSDDIPIFRLPVQFIHKAIEENEHADLSDQKKEVMWLEEKGYLFSALADTFVVSDSNTEWVTFTRYISTKPTTSLSEHLEVWSWVYAFFVKDEQLNAFQQVFQRGDKIVAEDLRYSHDIHGCYIREYPWSPSCNEANHEAWVETQLQTSEDDVQEAETFADYQNLLQTLGYGACFETPDQSCLSMEDDAAEDAEDDAEDVADEDAAEDDTSVLASIDGTEEQAKCMMEIEDGKILHAVTTLNWDSGYDATKESVNTFDVPCAEIIEQLQLRQQKYDGVYYDSSGRLAAFDTRISQGVDGSVVRKDLLEKFMDMTGLKLIWLVQAGKEIHSEDGGIGYSSDWEGLYTYDDGKVTGEMHIVG